jgi:hypothetical protein
MTQQAICPNSYRQKDKADDCAYRANAKQLLQRAAIHLDLP